MISDYSRSSVAANLSVLLVRQEGHEDAKLSSSASYRTAFIVPVKRYFHQENLFELVSRLPTRTEHAN
jgi:hypothetical protein